MNRVVRVGCCCDAMPGASCHFSTRPMASEMPQGGGRPCPGPPSLTRARRSRAGTADSVVTVSFVSTHRLRRRRASCRRRRHALPLRTQGDGWGYGRVTAVTTDVVGRLRGDHDLRSATPAVFSSSQLGRAGAFGRSGSGSGPVHSFPQAAKAASTGTKARPCSVRLYCVRLRTPEAVSSVSRRASVFSLIRNRSRLAGDGDVHEVQGVCACHDSLRFTGPPDSSTSVIRSRRSGSCRRVRRVFSVTAVRLLLG